MSSISSSIPNNHLLSTYCVSNTLKRAPGTYSRTVADGRGTAETPSWGPLEHQITVDSQCMGTDKGGDAPQTHGNSKLPAGLGWRQWMHILSLSEAGLNLRQIVTDCSSKMLRREMGEKEELSAFFRALVHISFHLICTTLWGRGDCFHFIGKDTCHMSYVQPPSETEHPGFNLKVCCSFHNARTG